MRAQVPSENGRLWMTSSAMRAAGFTPSGPEIDFGMRWGEHGTVRVSFAPVEAHGRGFLYAYDSGANRYLVLAPATTERQVEKARRELQPYLDVPEAYLALTAVAHREAPMSIEHARDLLVHCVDRELAALSSVRSAAANTPVDFEAARALIVQRSARIAAESLLRDSAGSEAEPVVVRYRIPQDRTWSGQIAERTVDRAAELTHRVSEVAEQRGLQLQATSVAHGWSTIAATRVPQLEFLTRRPELTLDAPQLAM